MPCSACSTKSLGAFILDLTGLNLKNTRPFSGVIGPALSIRRHVSNRPPLRPQRSHQASVRSVTTSPTVTGDDLYVPFEFSGSSVGISSAARKGQQNWSLRPSSPHHLQAAASDRKNDSSLFRTWSVSTNQTPTDSPSDVEASANIESSARLSSDAAGHPDKATTNDAILELSAASIEALSAESRNDEPPRAFAVPNEHAVPSPQTMKPIPALKRSIARTDLETTKPRRETPGTVVEADNWIPPKREQWQIQKASLSEKFKNEAWNPRKRLSPDALEGIRVLNSQYPERYTTPVLAAKFEVSSEVIRRILKSKWRPSEEEAEDRKRRWDKRGEKIWGQMVELGVKPPKKWRDMGIGKAEDGNPTGRKRNLGSGLGSSGKGNKSWVPIQTTASNDQAYGGAASEYEPLEERIL
ncbi:MAG: hypothetical protein M1812_004217 [Candelaria pacifica]|nr:MAG: hypothetical protein M1812_004217 [Candelaria pacifica]